MPQREITARTPLLDANGRLINAGYARHLNFEYDKGMVKCSPLALKEWDFYQISNDRYVLQMTIGHVSYASSVSANLIDLESGEKQSCSVMQLFPGKDMVMESDGEDEYMLIYDKPDFNMRFEVSRYERLLTLDAKDKRGLEVHINVRLTNCSPEKEKLVIATPFKKRNQFYLNYKENCYYASGLVDFSGRTVTFGEGSYGLLDWGRGVWPYCHEWIWGNGSAMLDGKPFGFNIGWGFGDTSAATENMFFYDNRAYKLGVVESKILGEREGLPLMSYRDKEGRFVFTAVPMFDNHSDTNMVLMHTTCHQIFGRWSGVAITDDGMRLELRDMLAFCEHAKNRW